MTITLITASFLGLLFFYLSYGVVKNRFRAKVSIGSGGDEGLENAIRAHANFAEYVPLVLVLFGLLETQGVNEYLLIAMAAFFTVGRYMHGLTFGKFEGRNPFRFWGIIFTWVVLLVASITGLVLGFNLL
ncbi:MAG: MAPEG family protein [Alphaproteobacteria bacterium]|nr:MAPEG family protein [Alphaproteobacteria bacterium]